MSKHPKRPPNNQQSGPGNDHREDDKECVSDEVRIKGQVVTDFPPSLIEEYKAANRNAEARYEWHNTRENKRFVVESITLTFVVLVALIGVFQAYQVKRSTDAAVTAANATKDSVQTARDQFHLENRAYLSTGQPEEILGTYFVVKIPIFNTGHVPTNGDQLRLWFERVGKNAERTELRVFDYKTTARIPPGKDAYFYTIMMPTTPIEDQGRKFEPAEGLRLKGMMNYDTGFGVKDTLYMCYDYVYVRKNWRNCSGQSMNIWLNKAKQIDPNSEPELLEKTPQ